MRTCLLQITGYKQLYQDVENVRKKPYDSGNAQHEKLLLKVGAGSVCGGQPQLGEWCKLWKLMWSPHLFASWRMCVRLH